MNAKKTLSISFIIPVLNAERHLPTCLKSIRAQDYPRELVEIVVLDGGCVDSTVEIAESYDARVYENPGRLAEYGLQVGIAEAAGELVVIFAADNELCSTDWVQRAVDAFTLRPGCAAVWGPLKSGPDDPPINRYFELIQSDPMTSFVNRFLKKYLKAPATEHVDGRHYFRVDPARPLVWGANGLTMRKDLVAPIWAQEGYLGDNDAFQTMVEQGHDLVAYDPGLVTYHHHVGEIKDWVFKWKRNFIKHFLDKLETRNTNWVFVKGFRTRLVLWVLYSTIPLVSGAHALYLAVRDRNPYWAYHPVLSFMQTFVYCYLVVSTREGRRTIMKVAGGAV